MIPSQYVLEAVHEKGFRFRRESERCKFFKEVEEDVGAIRRMHDFGVELDPVEFA